jgi:hypothetical protein
MSALFHIVELVHRDDQPKAKARNADATSDLRVVTVKLVADSHDDAKRIALERYPDYCVLRHSTRPTDSKPDPDT